MLQAGDRIPDFTLASGAGDTVSSSALRGRRFVVYFYPKDDTPGCTKEACGFRDARARFAKAGVPVYGVSADSVAAHARFAQKYSLDFPLLSDPDRKVIEGFGTWVEKQLYGRRYMGIARATFLVGADGRVEKVWEKVTPATHADDVLAHLGGAAPASAKPVAGKAVAKKAAVKKAAAPKPAAKKAAKKSPAAKKPARKATR